MAGDDPLDTSEGTDDCDADESRSGSDLYDAASAAALSVAALPVAALALVLAGTSSAAVAPVKTQAGILSQRLRLAASVGCVQRSGTHQTSHRISGTMPWWVTLRFTHPTCLARIPGQIPKSNTCASPLASRHRS